MAETSQAHQGSHNQIEQRKDDEVTERELAERKAAQGNRKRNAKDARTDSDGSASGSPIANKHERPGLDKASQENAQHPFNAEVAEEVDRQSHTYGNEEELVTIDEYGETIGQPYGESDEHGDTTTPRMPESGHTEEEGDQPQRRGDRKKGKAKDQRGGVTGT